MQLCPLSGKQVSKKQYSSIKVTNEDGNWKLDKLSESTNSLDKIVDVVGTADGGN